MRAGVLGTPVAEAATGGGRAYGRQAIRCRGTADG